MSLVGQDIPAIGCIPDLDRGIPGGIHRITGTRGDALAIGGPCYRVYRSCMASIGPAVFTSSRKPELYCSVIGSRTDKLTIGRPRHRIHCKDMASIGHTVPPGGCIPYLYCVVVASRGDVLAIGRPRYGIHLRGMS